MSLAWPLRASALERAAVCTFFAALLALGWAVHRDYGMPWDEVDTRRCVGLAN